MSDWQAIIDETIEQLIELRDNEPTLRAHWKTYRRGGLPSTSFSTGPKSAESPLPMPDKVDSKISKDAVAIGRLLFDSRSMIRMATATAGYWLNVAPPEPEPILTPCANLACDRVPTGKGNDRLRDGVCGRCYTFERRHGRSWSPSNEIVVLPPTPPAVSPNVV